MPNRYGENDEQPSYPQAQPNPIDPQEAAALRSAAIENCQLCNGDGYRGGAVCDHVDHQDAAKRGMDMIREAMGWES